jgi:hypothetical protein
VLVAAAVCPHPPLLIPAATGGPGSADPPVSRLRAACAAAVSRLIAASPDLVIVVGADDRTLAYPADAAGSLSRFGIPVSTGTSDPVLPLPLTIGAWLLRAAAPGPARTLLHGVASDMAAADCLDLGKRLAAAAARVGMLVMGDGSARRAVGRHGATDQQADAYDSALTAAFAAADAGQLAALDPARDAELLVAGRAAWQVLAGAAQCVKLRGHLLFAGAPLDVSYVVATWGAPERPTGPGGVSDAPEMPG